MSLCECCYAESHYVECRNAECRYAECHYAECRYAECRYADCHYSECRGAILPSYQINVARNLSMLLYQNSEIIIPTQPKIYQSFLKY